jgi:hypothetical protein
MTRRILTLLTALVIALGGITTITAAAATAANCSGRYQVRGDPWDDDYVMDSVGGIPDPVHGHGIAVYRYFPNTTDAGHRSIMVTEFRNRVTDVDRRLRFDGMTFRSGATEAGTFRDVDKSVAKADNGTSTIRGVAVIPLRDRVCMEADDEPRDGPVVWWNEHEGRFSNWPNTVYEFTASSGIPQNTIHPDAGSTIRYGTWQTTN